MATRPIESNGLALVADQVVRQIRAIEDFADALTESNRSFEIWKRLFAEQSVIGVKVHDTRIVSVMLADGISQILTLNERDFRRYSGISARSP